MNLLRLSPQDWGYITYCFITQRPPLDQHWAYGKLFRVQINFAWDCCWQLCGCVEVIARTGSGFCARSHGSVCVHKTASAYRVCANVSVLTGHRHTSENEIFKFTSYSCSSNPYFLYYSLIGVADWSLWLNEFQLWAIAGCSFLNLPRNQTSPPSDAAQQTQTELRLNSCCSNAEFG